MEIKDSTQGVLIYLAMAVHLLAFALAVAGRRRGAQAAYACGFGVVVCAFLYRWVDVGHVPLQNLFEVFLVLGMVWPLSVFCRRVLGVAGESADMVLAVVVLFPAGFVFSAAPQHLPPALQSSFFVPHVGAYMAAYIILAKAALQAAARLGARPAARLLGRREPSVAVLAGYEQGAYRMSLLGFPLLTLGLLLGSIWGKYAWGDFWNWDPKELWSLVSWLMFLVYFHVRHLVGRRYPRLNCGLVVGGMTAIVVTLLWVNLARIFVGLHSYAT